MPTHLSKMVMIYFSVIFSASLFGQNPNEPITSGTTNAEPLVFIPNFNSGNAFPTTNFKSSASFTGSTFFRSNNPMALFETFMRQMNLKIPSTGYRFISSNGMNLQAGLLMNSRQPKLGASFSMARGLNFSAGYGINSNNLMRPGSMSMGRNPGLQFSASYRLFKKK